MTRILLWTLMAGNKRWLGGDGVSLLFIEVVPVLRWMLQSLLKLRYHNATLSSHRAHASTSSLVWPYLTVACGFRLVGIVVVNGEWPSFTDLPISSS